VFIFMVSLCERLDEIFTRPSLAAVNETMFCGNLKHGGLNYLTIV